MLGICKWFKEDLGYGFVVDETGKNYFVHWSGISSEEKFKKLYPLQMVSFEVGQNDKGEIAVDVKPVIVAREVEQQFTDILVSNGYDMSVANRRLEYVKKKDKFYKGGNTNE